MSVVYVVMARENAYEPYDYPQAVFRNKEDAVKYSLQWPELLPKNYTGYRPEIWEFPIDEIVRSGTAGVNDPISGVYIDLETDDDVK